MFRSKRISLLAIFTMLISSMSFMGMGATAANADFLAGGILTYKVNGQDVAHDGTINLAPGTTSVSIEIASDAYIYPWFEFNGKQIEPTLVPQNHTWYQQKVVVDGVEVCGDNLEGRPYATTEDKTLACDYNAETDTATVLYIEPRRFYTLNTTLTGLVSGDQTIRLEAKDDHNLGAMGFSTTSILHVEPMFSSLTVNDAATVEGSTIDLAPYTSSVDVAITTIDPLATVSMSVAGGTPVTEAVDGKYTLTGLTAAGNDLVITVTNPAVVDDPATADIDETKAELVGVYTINLNVLLSTDTGAAFTVNGNVVVEGEDIYVDYGTPSVDVTVTPNDINATYFVNGDLDLVTGDNDLMVTVMAVNADYTQEYHFNIIVKANPDASVNYITVNGMEVVDGSYIDLEPLTAEVDVQVDTTDVEATYEIDGDHDLVTGENQLMITVTAADGETQQQWFITMNVLPNTDVSLTSLTVNGIEAGDMDRVVVDPLTTEVEVLVETTDPNATFEIEGGTDLVAGENDLLVTVTAADGETIGTTYVVIEVALNTDTSIESLAVNGEATDDGGVVYLDPFTTEVTVDITTTDPNATFVIDGDSNLMVGENDLVIIVTAADEMTTQDYLVTLVVAASNDASLVGINIVYNTPEGEQTYVAVDGDELELPSKTYEVAVTVETTDGEATYEVSGATDLVVGENTLTVTVIAPDGETSEDYYVTLMVLVGDVTTSVFSVNDTDVADGDVIDLEPGTEDVTVMVETTDEDATFEVTGDTGLVLGENTLTVSVTSVDGTLTVDYKVTLNVLPWTDASFSSIEVNGVVWEDGVVIETEAGDLDVVVALNNEYATVRVIGNTTNVSGVQHLTVEVTAQDGETVESAEIDVLASTDIEVVSASTDGELRVGTYAKMPRAQFDKAAKLSYFWLRDLDQTPIATSSKYLLSLDDFGHDLRAGVIVTMKGMPDTIIVSKNIEVLPGFFKKAPTPAIKGKAVVGNTLTATTKDWIDGTELAIQWYKDGEAIDGATSDTLDLTGEEFDGVITVGFTGTLEGYEPLEKVSTGVKIAAGTLKYIDRPGISGDFVTGGTVEVNPGVWPDGAEVSIVWMRDGEELQTTSADENTMELTADDYKHRLSVNIVVTAIGYKDAIFKMKSRAIKIGTLAEVPVPVINGDPIAGETIDVDMGEYPDGAEFKYVWKRDGRVIHSAYDAAYTLTARDINTTITVKVIATIPGYKTTRVESEGVQITPAQ